jgi:hypothetical protein
LVPASPAASSFHHDATIGARGPHYGSEGSNITCENMEMKWISWGSWQMFGYHIICIYIYMDTISIYDIHIYISWIPRYVLKDVMGIYNIWLIFFVIHPENSSNFGEDSEIIRRFLLRTMNPVT